MIKVNVANPFYFQRGTMSLNDRLVKAIKAGKKLVAVDKTTKATYPVNNAIALSTLREIKDPFSGLFLYYVANFK